MMGRTVHMFAGPSSLAVNDSASMHELALAEQLDARFAATVEGVKQLGGLFQVDPTPIQPAS
jgi:hypothetical protein